MKNAARTALWARIHDLKLGDIDSALQDSRALVRTSCMRQTLHLLPSADFDLYITALRRSRLEALRRITDRFDITDKEIDRLNQLVLQALAGGPVSQRRLIEQIKPQVGKRVRAWMERVSSPFRFAMVEGLVCYGPERGQEAILVRVDQWLPRRRTVEEDDAKQVLLRRYLSAYGPATVRDFSHWSGISNREAKPIWESLSDELMEVSIEDIKASILRKDAKELVGARAQGQVVRLVPGFDPYLLAHAEKDHLVNERFYKRVYRDQWWISSTVLLNGRVIGVWSLAGRAKAQVLEVELFDKVSRTTRGWIEEEARSLGEFLQAPLRVSLR